MDRIKVLIIDDELLARELVRSYLIDFPQIEIVGELSDGFQGIKAINETKPDLVFLDVQMPKLTGFEMLELLENMPNIIFTTAYNEYAIKAFEHNAIDYLLKPFSKERFQAAVEKGMERVRNQEVNREQVNKLVEHQDEQKDCINRVVVKSGSKIHVIPVNLIRYIEAQDDYVMIYTEEGRHLKQKTMKYFQNHLDENEFCRIHRSYIVRVNQIVQLEPYEKESWVVVLKKGEKLKVSRNGYKQLKAMLEF